MVWPEWETAGAGDTAAGDVQSTGVSEAQLVRVTSGVILGEPAGLQ